MACASSGKSSCADARAVGRGLLLVDFLGDALRELLDEALDKDFADVAADDVLLLPFCFLFFGPLFLFFCTFEVVASGLVAAGRFAVFAFLPFPPAAFARGAGGTPSEALERVVGAMLLSCGGEGAKQIHHSDS